MFVRMRRRRRCSSRDRYRCRRHRHRPCCKYYCLFGDTTTISHAPMSWHGDKMQRQGVRTNGA